MYPGMIALISRARSVLLLKGMSTFLGGNLPHPPSFNYHLLQTSDTFLVARRVDPVLGQERCVQPAFGVQRLGRGQ